MKDVGKAVVAGVLLLGLAVPLLAAGAGAPGGERRAERLEAAKERHEAKYQERKTEVEKRHAERMAKLKARLDASNRLTDPQKQEIMAFFEQQYTENMTFWNKQHEENVTYLGGLIARNDLTGDQIRQMIRDHVTVQKAEWEKERAQQKTEGQAEKAKIKGEVVNGQKAGP